MLKTFGRLPFTGAKLDEIITAIIGKGGTVASPQQVAEIVEAIEAVASWDADCISGNILTGKNIFGVAGNVEPGKYATGSITSTDTSQYFTDAGNNLVLSRSITVTGLTFMPRIIIAHSNNANAPMVYNADGFYAGTKFYGGNPTTYIKLISPAAVNSSGFTMPVYSSSTNYIWIAMA